MKPMILRTSLSLVALGAALAAHAVTISLVSAGTYAITGADTYTQDEKVLVSDTAPLPALTSMHLDGVYSTGMQTATYTGGGSTLVLDLVFINTVSNGGAKTDQGTWSYVTGTGGYAPGTAITGGTGTYSITYNPADGQFASTTIAGNLDAVPEPASVAALGVGALGLLRRRRKV
jgi:hypothetical protein